MPSSLRKPVGVGILAGALTAIAVFGGTGAFLAAAQGLSSLMRRTYKHPIEPAPDEVYEFINYFECAEAGVPTFHQVCAALRDVARNPEWRFVREGPTWHGRRVSTAAEMWISE